MKKFVRTTATRGAGMLASAAVLSILAVPASGQTNFGQVRGIVTDSTGALLPNASVIAVDQSNGSKRETKTNSAGEYILPSLNADPYKITITAPGFGVTELTITVTVGSANTADAKLAPGSTASTVEVASDSLGGINLETQDISQVVNSTQMVELPTANRNPYALTELSGFASSDSSAASRGVGLNFSGARSASVDLLLDGAENTDVFGVGVGQPIPLEATQELRVITANMPAQYGRASGGVVNVITRQGGNAFHGSAFEFNRISALSSNSYNSNALGQPKSRFTRNQFGYSFGGPIIHDKLFFFSSTEFLRIRSNALVSAAVALPGLISQSATATQAYFTAYGSKLTTAVNGPTYTLDFLGNNTSFKTDVGATGSATRATFLANNPGVNVTAPAFGIVNYQNPADSGAGTPTNSYDTINRIDWNISSKTTLTGRYSLASSTNSVGSNNTSPYAGYNTGSTNYDNNFQGTLIHVFSPSIVTNLRVLFSRLNNLQPLGANPVAPTLYANSSTNPTIGVGTLYFPGYSATSPGNAIPFGGPQNFGEIIGDTTVTKGTHSVTFGGQFLYIKDNRVFGAYENAVQALGNNGTSYAGSITNFLHGQVGLFQAAINPQGELPCVRNPTTAAYMVTTACTLQLPLGEPNFSRSNRYKDYALFAQDSWKATRRLTVNYGLRWEVYGPQHSQRASLDANFFPGRTGSLYDRVAQGQVFTRANSPVGGLWKNNYTQFGPRLGFAYDLTGDGKTSLRGGYGISYERNFDNVTFNVIQNPPNYGVVSFTTAANGNQTLSTANLGPLAGASGTLAFPNPTLRAVDPYIKPSYTHAYDVSIERQVAPRTAVSLTYTGERGIHNYSIANINRSYYGGLYEGYTVKALRANLQYSSINFRGADGDSYYNGLDVGLNSSDLFHSGVTVTAHYTYSHSTDNTSSTFTDGASNNTNLGYLDPTNHGLDHGNSDFDLKHRLVVAPIWQVPFFRNYTGIAKRIFDGFEVTSIFTASTGNPFTEFDESACVTVCGRAAFNTRPNYQRTGPATDLSAIYGANTFGYLNFPTYNPTNYTIYRNAVTGSNDYGPFPLNMSARNAFRGPGQYNVDGGVYKTIPFTERYKLQLRAEAYNVSNHANLYLNNGGANDISSYPAALAFKQGRRITQLAARFTF